MKPVAFFDTECFHNFWLLKFRPRGEAARTFWLGEGMRIDPQAEQIVYSWFEDFTVVSFNGLGYDVPMVTGMFCRYTPEELKVLNDRIIVMQIKPWELNLPDWKPADHIDVMEVAPGAGSLKQYGGRIHSKRLQDLPYSPDKRLEPHEMVEVASYCENDLNLLEDLYNALKPQLDQRVALSNRYGVDLRSKSDAQLAEAVLRHRCEQAVGRRLYKQDPDFNKTFRYRTPEFINFVSPQLQNALREIQCAVFGFGRSVNIEMPFNLENLEVNIGSMRYTLGIGGLHSQEKQSIVQASDIMRLIDIDVASYYPSLILNSGEYPPALGSTFIEEYRAIKEERLAAKALQGKLKKQGDTTSDQYHRAHVDNEGGKIMINGTFGKTGSAFSILFAPEMLIQTTLTGQLSLLMLIEWMDMNGIPVISANTDGIVTACPVDRLESLDVIVKAWEKRTGLETERTEYRLVCSRDVNNYLAVKLDGEVKRKGEYAKAGLIEKKNPDAEICSDAVADYLARGVPVELTIWSCQDIRKFVTMQRVSGGGVKLWGECPRKDAKMRDVEPLLEQHGWVKLGRRWARGEQVLSGKQAYEACFSEPRREYLGKVVRWYYGTASPGPIVYATNGNTVGGSYGAKPCMTLPDEFPDDIDYNWYIAKANSIMSDLGFYVRH